MKKKFIYSTAIGMAALAMGVLVACDSEWKEKTIVWDDPSYLPDTTYMNPVFEPVLADPTYVKAVDGTFYAYGTEDTWTDGVHHIVPILSSKDMVNWTYVSDAFTSSTKPSWGTANAGVWAPQIYFNEGTYYLYYSLSTWGDGNPGIGVATSKSPEGPFTDEGKILDQNSSGVTNGIDPFFITTGSGRLKKSYLFWGSWGGIHCVEMSDYKTPKMDTKKQIGGNMFEAAYIYEYDGKFYFFGSAGSCCEGADSQYRVTVARADKITGPYVRKDGVDIVTNNVEGEPFLKGDKTYGWVGPGHNAEITQDDKGRYFIMYHAIDVNEPLLPGGASRRALMLDEITWTEDGWPVINAGTDAEGMPSRGAKESPYFEGVE